MTTDGHWLRETQHFQEDLWWTKQEEYAGLSSFNSAPVQEFEFGFMEFAELPSDISLFTDYLI